MGRGQIAIGEYYHVYNRGNNKQEIFYDERDWIRFLSLIIYSQSTSSIYNISRKVSYFFRHQCFNISEDFERELLKDRLTELVAFVFMPNHFHFILHETKEGGISKYMQRIQDGYTKYINIKNKKSGHLFQGVFQRVWIESNKQLLHLSAYIHRNPRELPEWKNKELKYPWSSFCDYTGENRWGKFLQSDIILCQFSNTDAYHDFVKTSGTKLLSKEHLL